MQDHILVEVNSLKKCSFLLFWFEGKQDIFLRNIQS